MRMKVEACEAVDDPETALLAVTGEANVRVAGELKQLIHDALGSAGEIVLDVSGVTGADPSFFQLLCAAHRTAMARDKRFALGPIRSGEFLHAARAAGFPPAPGPCGENDTCLHEKEEVK